MKDNNMMIDNKDRIKAMKECNKLMAKLLYNMFSNISKQPDVKWFSLKDNE